MQSCPGTSVPSVLQAPPGIGKIESAGFRQLPQNRGRNRGFSAEAPTDSSPRRTPGASLLITWFPAFAGMTERDLPDRWASLRSAPAYARLSNFGRCEFHPQDRYPPSGPSTTGFGRTPAGLSCNCQVCSKLPRQALRGRRSRRSTDEQLGNIRENCVLIPVFLPPASASPRVCAVCASLGAA